MSENPGTPRTEKEKMLVGEPYVASDPQLQNERLRARELLAAFRATADGDVKLRRALWRELFGAAGEGLWIEPPFFCDYGYNIRFGAGVFLNFNCVFLDVAPITVGDRALFGPAVQVYTASHPLDYVERAQAFEFGAPVSIGDDAWIGGGAILLPGVRVGTRCVVGAGSVVTKDLPAGTLAAGNPCRVLRKL